MAVRAPVTHAADVCRMLAVYLLTRIPDAGFMRISFGNRSCLGEIIASGIVCRCLTGTVQHTEILAAVRAVTRGAAHVQGHIGPPGGCGQHIIR